MRDAFARLVLCVGVVFFGIGVDVLSHGDGDFTSIARVDYRDPVCLKEGSFAYGRAREDEAYAASWDFDGETGSVDDVPVVVVGSGSGGEVEARVGRVGVGRDYGVGV